ncbi:hypothetical protein C8R42DRAFT_72904 [Lentinula raphanica]|nr:hypothetical protein C8R42DRAFT_72904 [Lentinula raphanica]
MAVPKQADSQSEGEYTNPSSSFDTTTYGTASNYPSLPYPQSNTQQSTLPTDMTRYNYTQLSNYHDQYRGTSQANYPLYQTGLPVDYPQIQEDVSRVNYAHHQASPITYSQHEGLPAPLDYSQQHSQESYSTAPYDHSTATWSNLTESYNADSGMSGSTHGLAPHVQPTRYSSYPPTSYTPVTNSNYTPYPLSGLSASLSSSPSSSSDSNPLPSSSYPRSWHATTSYLPPDPHQYSPYSANPLAPSYRHLGRPKVCFPLHTVQDPSLSLLLQAVHRQHRLTRSSTLPMGRESRCCFPVCG